jgi:ribonuclease R
MRMIGLRSGEAISLGDPMGVVIEDVAILRRTVYGRRVGGEPSTKDQKRGGVEGRRGGRGQKGTSKHKGRDEKKAAARGRPEAKGSRKPDVVSKKKQKDRSKSQKKRGKRR